MINYYLPKGMHFSNLMERSEFYIKEFNVKAAAEWFDFHLGNTKFAVIMGRHTKIVQEKYREDIDTTIIIDKYRDIEELKAQVTEFLPEAVYYDRNIYGETGEVQGQELAFDLDPENVTCPIHGTLVDKMKRHQGLSFCEIELEMVQQEAVGLYEHLAKQYSQLKITYSGRGFHIHVFDQDAYDLTTAERAVLAQEVKNAGFQIDEWVTTGEFRLIRLPYSLNGIVSRIVLPLEKEELEGFDAIYDSRTIPDFIGTTT